MNPIDTPYALPVTHRYDLRYCPATRLGIAHMPHRYRYSLNTPDSIRGHYDCSGLTEAEEGHPWPER